MTPQVIQSKIHTIRNQQVILDFDIAALYGVETRIIKRAVRRNPDRFPEDFMFELTKSEVANLTSQFGMSSWGGTRHPPFAFTDYGVTMLSSVLKSETAIRINIAVVREFIAVKKFAVSNKELSDKLKALEEKYDKKFNTVHQALDYLLRHDREEARRLEESQKKRGKLGF